MTPLEMLDLPDDASAVEIKTRWRQLAKLHHPDHGGDGEVFNKLREAYNKAYKQAMKPKRCPECNGTKRIFTNHGFATTSLTCQTCKGTGEVRQ